MPENRITNMCLFEGTFQQNSVDEEKRTCTVAWYTGARVARYSWSEGKYMLELDMNPNAVDLTRLQSGTAPLLNAHSTWDLSSVIGVIEEAHISNGIGYATVRFSRREKCEEIFRDVKDGVLRNISMGAEIDELSLIEEHSDAPNVYRATKWSVHELSLVPIGADPNAQTLSKKESVAFEPHNFIKNGGNEMTEPINTPITEPQPVPAISPEAELAAVRTAERNRISEIHRLCRAHAMTDEFESACIANGTELSAVRSSILEELSHRQPNVSSVHVGEDDGTKKREAFTQSLLNRAMPGKYNAADGGGYRGRSMLEMARKYMCELGIKCEDLSRREIAELALCGRTSMGGMMGSSDMPLILGNTVARRLRDDYNEMAPTWPQFCSRATASDFKEMTVVALAGKVAFEDILEHGEYTRGSMVEESEKYKVKKSGRVIALTMEMMMNDDLGAFNRIPRMIASAARAKEADTVYGILTGNPNMADGSALFSSAHSNVASAAGVPSETTLSAALETMYAQTGINGEPINVLPKYLIHGPKNLVTVKKILSTDMLASKSGDINVFKGEFIPVMDQHITDKGWFLLSESGMCDTIEYAYLDGEEGIYTETRNGFEVDGIEIKARLIFGAAAIDYRGMYKNAGA